jgi:hypothetical protein
MPRSTGPIFLWLIGGDWRNVSFDDQPRRSFKMAAILDFCQSSHQLLGRLVRFVCGLLGVIGGSFLSMISAAAHWRWLVWHPSWIWFPLIFWQRPGSTGYLHLVWTHDIPHHPTLPFHLVPNVTTYNFCLLAGMEVASALW